MDAKEVISALKLAARSAKVNILSSFFKSGPGEYGEGDEFIGVSVPDQRKIAKKYASLNLKQIMPLLASKIHEHRLTALLILVSKFEAANTQTERGAIVEFYLAQRRAVNNWDLVDSSARQILGTWLLDKPDAQILYDFAASKNLWERRIAIVATHAFIMQRRFEHTLRISKILMLDKHDLMHKAVGWMLREMGKRDEKPLRVFLDAYAHVMPRTMLRYSIERLDIASKKKYMRK